MRPTLLLVLLLAQFPHAVGADDDSLRRCRTLAADAARLACYDAIALAPAAAAAAASAVAAPVARFGLPEAADRIERVDSRIEGRFEGWRPLDRIRLANGQVWQVIDGSRGVYWLDSPRAAVRRGALGSFVLEIEGVRALVRVSRIE
ncbi:MAG: hypothetical protein RL227_1843 [Pseudomonadota bacterium]|jgi:hypothetical protein